jgi:hypothetical protein
MPTIEELQQDPLVMSVARALLVANQAAAARGTEAEKSLVTISEDCSLAGPVWRIIYAPRGDVNRRGGELIVFVDRQLGTVHRIVHGQ